MARLNRSGRSRVATMTLTDDVGAVRHLIGWSSALADVAIAGEQRSRDHRDDQSVRRVAACRARPRRGAARPDRLWNRIGLPATQWSGSRSTWWSVRNARSSGVDRPAGGRHDAADLGRGAARRSSYRTNVTGVPNRHEATRTTRCTTASAAAAAAGWNRGIDVRPVRISGRAT